MGRRPRLTFWLNFFSKLYVTFILKWIALIFGRDEEEDQRQLSLSLLFKKNLSIIMKTCLYNFDPLKPHFFIVKLGFTGVYIIFHISAQNIDCGYSLEPPRRGSSNEYPQSMF